MNDPPLSEPDRSFSPFVQQPHSIVQRRLLEGNITRLRGEARDPSTRVRSPLADNKDGAADAEEKSESTADDSTEERESLEESERSLRSDEEDDSSEAGARQTAEKTEGTGGSTLLSALVVQCKVMHWDTCTVPAHSSLTKAWLDQENNTKFNFVLRSFWVLSYFLCCFRLRKTSKVEEYI